jgi:hypothetical protein
MYNANNFFFPFFFCWGGWGRVYMMHTNTHYAHTVKYFFYNFSFHFLCVMDCGASQKGRRCFSFLLTGKRNTKSNRIGTRKRKETARFFIVVEWGCKSQRVGGVKCCVQKHWISLLEIINKKFSCFHFFSFFFLV